MIQGKKVILRVIQSEAECDTWIELYNCLTERTPFDHTLMASPVNLKNRWKETGLWSPEEGWLLITGADDDMKGILSFKKTTDLEVEVGYRLFKPVDRNKGLMTEALRLFTSYLFEIKPITRIKLQIAENNEASIKLAEKCGFVHEGTLRKAYFCRGRYLNFLIYGMLREECGF